MTLLLASASPRRRELLTRAGFSFRTVPSRVEERPPRAGEDPIRYSSELARTKAEEVAKRFPSETILSADTVVTVDGEILGKPSDPADAARMLRALRDRRHQVITSVTIQQESMLLEDHMATDVFMRAYEDQEIERYVAGGEPMDKAGAYAVQGDGGRLVESVRGCYNGVIGLPLCLVCALLQRTDAHLPEGEIRVCDHRA